MRPRLLLAGAALSAVLTIVAVLGAVQEWWWLVVAAAMILLSLTLLASLDADRRARSLRPFIKHELARGGVGQASAAAQAPPVTESDVVGAVRVLQAQYTGRLDRMQTSVDEALSQLRARGGETEDTEGDRA